MTPANADRLVRRASDTRRGRRGLRARGALRQVVCAGERGDVAVIDATWERWLHQPDEALWELLARWGRPASRSIPPLYTANTYVASLVMLQRPLTLTNETTRRGLVDLAGRSHHPVGEIARARILGLTDPDLVEAVCEVAQQDPTGTLAGFCVEHHLAPADPVDRAAFLVLTGQDDRYRALDVDGSLLASAYRAADMVTQARLREALVRAGDLDRARVVAGADRGDRVAHLGSEEIAYFARQLAGRRDWHQLWRLVREVPLARGLEAMALFADWTPDVEAGRRLFEHFSRTRPETVAAADAVLRLAHRTKLGMPERGLPWDVTAASFSPDLAELAVASFRRATDDHGRRSIVEVFTLSTGEISSQCGPFRGKVVAVLHLGDAVGVANRRVDKSYSSGPDGTPLEVLRVAGRHRRMVLRRHDGWLWWRGVGKDLLIRLGCEFAVVTAGGHVIRDHGTGVEPSSLSLVDRGLTEPGLADGAVDLPPPAPLAVDAGSVRLAMSDPRGGCLTIVDRDLQVVAHSPEHGLGLRSAVFDGPNRLITVSRRVGRGDLICSWRIDGDRLDKVTLSGLRGRYGPTNVSQPVVLPGRVQAVCTGTGAELFCFDAATLRVVEPPAELGRAFTTAHFASPGGELVLAVNDVSRPAKLTVHNMVGRLRDVVDRPVGAMTVADLRAVAHWEHYVSVRSVKQTLGLLRACLEHRFGSEVALGKATSAAVGGPHDIGLSSTEGSSG